MSRLSPPKKEELDPIEIASRDEISALQLDRLKQSVHHAYSNVAIFKARFDEAGVYQPHGNATAL